MHHTSPVPGLHRRPALPRGQPHPGGGDEWGARRGFPAVVAPNVRPGRLGPSRAASSARRGPAGLCRPALPAALPPPGLSRVRCPGAGSGPDSALVCPKSILAPAGRRLFPGSPAWRSVIGCIHLSPFRASPLSPLLGKLLFARLWGLLRSTGQRWRLAVVPWPLRLKLHRLPQAPGCLSVHHKVSRSLLINLKNLYAPSWN